jgi:hypothetical protein
MNISDKTHAGQQLGSQVATFRPFFFDVQMMKAKTQQK